MVSIAYVRPMSLAFSLCVAVVDVRWVPGGSEVVEAEDADEQWDKRGDGGRGACVRSSSNASSALFMHTHEQRTGR